jgi:hypothetical protein
LNFLIIVRIQDKKNVAYMQNFGESKDFIFAWLNKNQADEPLN